MCTPADTERDGSGRWLARTRAATRADMESARTTKRALVGGRPRVDPWARMRPLGGGRRFGDIRADTQVCPYTSRVDASSSQLRIRARPPCGHGQHRRMPSRDAIRNPVERSPAGFVGADPRVSSCVVPKASRTHEPCPKPSARTGRPLGSGLTSGSVDGRSKADPAFTSPLSGVRIRAHPLSDGGQHERTPIRGVIRNPGERTSAGIRGSEPLWHLYR